MNKQSSSFDWDEFANSTIWLVLTAFVLITLCLSLGACGGGGGSPQLTEPANTTAKHGPDLRCNEAPEAPKCPVAIQGQPVIH